MQIVRLIKLPIKVRGLVVQDCDGNYNIYINKNYSGEAQKNIYLHETSHVNSDDFYSVEPVTVLEDKACF